MAERNSKIKLTLQYVDCYTHKRKQTAQYNKPIKKHTHTSYRFLLFIPHGEWRFSLGLKIYVMKRKKMIQLQFELTQIYIIVVFLLAVFSVFYVGQLEA